MKTRLFVPLLIIPCFFGISFSAFAANSVRSALAAVPSVEMPARAAEMVLAAKPKDRNKLTADVVITALSLNPAAAVPLVGAISTSVPDMASVAAHDASELQPKQAVEIAKAAAAAAPRKAGQIVAAVCRVAPKQYKLIAEAVAQVCPASSKEILEAVASVCPELRADIEKLLAGCGANPPSVAAVLGSLKNPNAVPSGSVIDGGGTATLSAGSPGSRGPTVGPPYVPYSSSGPNVTPSTSGTVPRGQRTYASP